MAAPTERHRTHPADEKVSVDVAELVHGPRWETFACWQDGYRPCGPCWRVAAALARVEAEGLAATARKSLETAVAAEREACARAICPDCDEGFALDADGHHVFGALRQEGPCPARAIRQRAVSPDPTASAGPPPPEPEGCEQCAECHVIFTAAQLAAEDAAAWGHPCPQGSACESTRTPVVFMAGPLAEETTRRDEGDAHGRA